MLNLCLKFRSLNKNDWLTLGGWAIWPNRVWQVSFRQCLIFSCHFSWKGRCFLTQHHKYITFSLTNWCCHWYNWPIFLKLSTSMIHGINAVPKQKIARKKAGLLGLVCVCVCVWLQSLFTSQLKTFDVQWKLNLCSLKGRFSVRSVPFFFVILILAECMYISFYKELLKRYCCKRIFICAKCSNIYRATNKPFAWMITIADFFLTFFIFQ